MNNVVLTGRLVKDPDVRRTQSQKAVASFTLAVDRDYKNGKGEKETDFPQIVAWEKTAELVEKYLVKGRKIGVTGALRTRSYEDKDGKRVYVTEVLAEKIEFLERATQGENADSGTKGPAPGPGFSPVDDDDELPF